MSFSWFSTCSPPWLSYYSRVAVEPSSQRKCAPNPTHSTNPFHPITGVEHVRSVGYKWSFLPPLYPILFPQHTTYLPASSEGVFIKAWPGHPASPRQISELLQGDVEKEVYGQRPKKPGFSGFARGFFRKNPVPETLAGHRLRVTVGVFGVLFQLPGNFLNMTIEVR